MTTRERPPSKQRMARPTRPPWSSTVAAMNVDLDGSNGSGSFFIVIHSANAGEASAMRAAPIAMAFSLCANARCDMKGQPMPVLCRSLAGGNRFTLMLSRRLTSYSHRPSRPLPPLVNLNDVATRLLAAASGRRHVIRIRRRLEA